MTRKYWGCKTAAESTNKIIFNDNLAIYFDSAESAGDYLNRYASTAKENFTYEWYEKEIDWETGRVYDRWVVLEIGTGDHLKGWKNFINELRA